MKKLALLFAVLLMVSATSFAAESTEDMLKQTVYGLLTEVYGYTQEEAETFNIHVVQEDANAWHMQFYLHPHWVYTVDIRKDGLQLEDSHTPFNTFGTEKASENSVRYMLRAIRENGWFDSWTPESRAAFGAAVLWCGDIQMNASMERGLQSDEYSPAQALDDLFLSCYGDTSAWFQELKDWRDLAFYSFGLAQGEESAAMPQGVQNRTADSASICEFVGEVPGALHQAFSVSPLEGWECLAGAYRISDRFSMDGEAEGTGLAAFARGEERLLTLLVLDAKTQDWRVFPVGKTALLPGRELYITYESKNNRFNITYPVSDTERETFQCRILSLGVKPAVSGLLCELMEYRTVNTLENQSVAIAVDFDNPFSAAYTVTTTRDGNMAQTRYPALVCNLLDYIDVSVFPKSEEACKAASAESPGIPEGYGFSSNVHLRAEPSSHSKDLGMYRRGTLVEVLDVQPGSAFPWLHVRIGQAEGYMSSDYVSYQAGEGPNQRHIALGMAKTKNATALKDGASGFAKTVAELPQGAVLRVLLETGNWLHVSVPEDPADWMMRPGEVCGYVKANAVVQAATALQLSWLLPDRE